MKEKYKIGETYEKLGIYKGVVQVHPWNKNYYENRHRFITFPEVNTISAVGKSNEIFIERIDK